MQKYSNHFDTVLFSPPYFNLELYESENQSVDYTKSEFSPDDYSNWLSKYWNETCKLCSEVLSDNSTFAFVISDYKWGWGYVPISEDMLNIAKMYFDHVDTFTLNWHGFTTSSAEKRKTGNMENLFVLRKSK